MSSGEMMHQIGAFEPIEARKLLTAFEANGIPFELEAEDSPLAQAGTALQAELGMNPNSGMLSIFVPESFLSAAQQILSVQFPR
jgi:hypothetical protein